MRDTSTFTAGRPQQRGSGRGALVKCAVLAWLLLAYAAFSQLSVGASEPRKLVVWHGHPANRAAQQGHNLADSVPTNRRPPAQARPPQGRRAADATRQPQRAAATPPAQTAAAPTTPAVGGQEVEKDPRTGLELPRFWQPPSDLDLDAYVEEVGGEPTILVMIASYRDFQCPETVASALTRASHPERLRFVVVQQNGEGDVSCDQPPAPCAEKPEQPLCVHRGSMRVYTMDARHGVGPVYARHVGSRMYRGEAFVLQIDAHNEFVAGWDSDIVEQFRATKNEYAVLSTYLTDKLGSVDGAGHSKRRTRPIMCNTDFEAVKSNRSARAPYLRHGSQAASLYETGQSGARTHTQIRTAT